MRGWLNSQHPTIKLASRWGRGNAADDFGRSFRPPRVIEGESGGLQASWKDPTAFEREFGFGAEEEGTYFEHPTLGGQADPGSGSVADFAHEIAVRHWIRCGEIDRTADIFAVNEPLDGSAEIFVVKPRNHLIS